MIITNSTKLLHIVQIVQNFLNVFLKVSVFEIRGKIISSNKDDISKLKSSSLQVKIIQIQLKLYVNHSNSSVTYF